VAQKLELGLPARILLCHSQFKLKKELLFAELELQPTCLLEKL